MYQKFTYLQSIIVMSFQKYLIKSSLHFIVQKNKQMKALTTNEALGWNYYMTILIKSWIEKWCCWELLCIIWSINELLHSKDSPIYLLINKRCSTCYKRGVKLWNFWLAHIFSKPDPHLNGTTNIFYYSAYTADMSISRQLFKYDTLSFINIALQKLEIW